MSRQIFRANLSAGAFPFLSGSYGRTIVFPMQDENYIRPNMFSGVEADKNIGIPQLLYCENVMPFSTGFMSVGFTHPVPAAAVADFDQAFYLLDANENRTLFVPSAGKNYIYNIASNSWTSTPITPPTGSIVSIAREERRTFVCYSNHTSFFEWNGTLLVGVTLTALTPANIRGLTAASGYLIAWDFDTIYWSSTVTLTDFTPSLSTGAGSEKILGLKGLIVFCKPIEDGFLIHTTSGCWTAKYSGNIRFPWVFAELKGASGIGFQDDVCDAPDGTKYYVYGNDGLMYYDRLRAESIFPEVTEFLTCGEYETFNALTRNLDLTKYTARLNTKITFIGSRWIVLSYGISKVMNHAIVYDTTLKRFGKITIDHVDCFEYYGDPGNLVTTGGGIAWNQVQGAWNFQNSPWSAWGSAVSSGGLASSTTPYQSMGFLQANGQVSVVNWNIASQDSGVMVLGQFQFKRDKLTTLLDVEAEGLAAGCVLEVLTSYDGRNIAKTTQPLQTVANADFSKWQMRITGINHALRFVGGFRMVTVLLRTMFNGER